MSNPSLLTAMITPFNEQLEVNYKKTGELAEYLVDNGSDGLVVSGTTGESPNLSVEEKLKLFATVKEKVGKRAEVWAGTGSYNTRESVTLSKEAEKTGVNGVMLVTPYYNKPAQEGLYRHFKTIAESISLPVILYNVPGRTGSNLLPETVARLAEIDNIVAIKEASGSMDQVSKLKHILPNDFTIFSGDDSLTLPMLSLGAAGVISVASHILGKDIKEMIEAYFAGNVEKAMQKHNYLFPMFKGLFISSNPVPVKEALNLMGMDVGGFRLPLSNIGEEEMEFLKDLLNSYKLL